MVLWEENLLYRPGRASGERIIETPDAQLLKPMQFSCGVAYLPAAFNESNLEQLAKQYNTPVEVYEYSEFLNGRLIFSQMEVEGVDERAKSFFTSENNLVVSAIKNAEEKPGIVIRLYNGKDHKVLNDVLTFTSSIKKAGLMDLKEQVIEELHVENNQIILENIGHCKFVTVNVEL